MSHAGGPAYVAALSLGANLGDPGAAVERALDLIGRSPGIELVLRSSLYRTEPVGKVDQPMFINACAILRTHRAPIELLARTRAIERAMGRHRRERWREREIDIDLLLVDGLVLSTPALVLPHPEMHLRRFVLEPLAEIAPELRHPVFGLTVAELLSACSDTAAVHRAEGPELL